MVLMYSEGHGEVRGGGCLSPPIASWYYRKVTPGLMGVTSRPEGGALIRFWRALEQNNVASRCAVAFGLSGEGRRAKGEGRRAKGEGQKKRPGSLRAWWRSMFEGQSISPSETYSKSKPFMAGPPSASTTEYCAPFFNIIHHCPCSKSADKTLRGNLVRAAFKTRCIMAGVFCSVFSISSSSFQ